MATEGSLLDSFLCKGCANWCGKQGRKRSEDDQQLLDTPQKKALDDLYEYTEGDGWYINSGWSAAASPASYYGDASGALDVSKWQGVVALKENVMKLDLSKNNLAGGWCIRSWFCVG
jgi:hypothetical protein